MSIKYVQPSLFVIFGATTFPVTILYKNRVIHNLYKRVLNSRQNPLHSFLLSFPITTSSPFPPFSKKTPRYVHPPQPAHNMTRCAPWNMFYLSPSKIPLSFDWKHVFWWLPSIHSRCTIHSWVSKQRQMHIINEQDRLPNTLMSPFLVIAFWFPRSVKTDIDDSGTRLAKLDRKGWYTLPWINVSFLTNSFFSIRQNSTPLCFPDEKASPEKVTLMMICMRNGRKRTIFVILVYKISSATGKIGVDEWIYDPGSRFYLW